MPSKPIESDDPASVYYVERSTITINGAEVAIKRYRISHSLPGWRVVTTKRGRLKVLPPVHWNPSPMFGLREHWPEEIPNGQ